MQRGLIRFWLVAFAFPLMLASFASAVPDYSCPLGQQIFRISSQTNAHAEAYNGNGNYLTHICYDDYFGTFTGTRDFVCNSSNPALIRLSSFTSAHAEDPALLTPPYVNDICFHPTLSCVYQEANSVCAGGRVEIASFSARTNAHVGIPGSYTGAGKYRLCCRIGGGGPACSDGADNDGDGAIDYPNDFSCSSAADTDEANPRAQCQDDSDNDGDGRCDFDGSAGSPGCNGQPDAHCTSFQDNSESPGNLIRPTWRNHLDQQIGQSVGIKTWVNRTVQAVEYTTFPAGTNVNIEVWESDYPLPQSFDDFLANFTVPTTSDGRAGVYNYFINDGNISASSSNEANDEREFYFIARALGQTNTSDILLVNISVGPNTPPVANITAPTHRGVYYNGTTVLFNQSSIDFEGGNLSFYWTIAEDTFNSTQRTFTYQFRSPGQKTVTLRVTDDRGASHEDQVGIIVVASPGMFAFINQPDHRQILVSHDPYEVQIDANDSYALNSAGTCPSITVTCIAGVCPTQTQNSPCGAGTIPILNTPRGFGELYFDWSFSDGDQGPYADGFGSFHVEKRFSPPSGGPTDYKRADLRLNYTNSTIIGGGISMQVFTNRQFSILARCVDNRARWVEQYDPFTGQPLIQFNTRTTDYCKGPDGIYNNGDDCCPADATNCTSGGCRPSNVTLCSDIQSRNPCNDAPRSISWNENNPGYPEGFDCGDTVNGSIVDCECEWYNSSVQTGPYCRFAWSLGPGSWNGTDPPCTRSSCGYVPIEGPTECVNGYAVVTVRAEFTPGTCTIPPINEQNATCMAGAGQRTILCGRPTISLDFFGPEQFIITFIAILFVYYVWWMKKRR